MISELLVNNIGGIEGGLPSPQRPIHSYNRRERFREKQPRKGTRTGQRKKGTGGADKGGS